jgi:hypothetical protein
MYALSRAMVLDTHPVYLWRNLGTVHVDQILPIPVLPAKMEEGERLERWREGAVQALSPYLESITDSVITLNGKVCLTPAPKRQA